MTPYLYTLPLLLAATAHAAPTYSLTDLGPHSAPVSINNASQIALSLEFPTAPETAAIIQPNSPPAPLGPFANTPASGVLALNAQGTIAGYSYDPAIGSDSFHGFLWSPATGFHDPAESTGWTLLPNTLNSLGQLGGRAISNGSDFGFLWSPATGPVPLQLPNRHITAVAKLNDLGHMILLDADTSAALFYRPGADPVEMKNTHYLAANALAFNNNDAAVGTTSPGPDGLPHAYLWTPAGGLTDLTPGTGITSRATGVNDLNQIVGTQDNPDGTTTAFLYENNTAYALATRLDPSATTWTNLSPQSINNLGQIVGTGYTNSELHGFLLTPTSSATTPIPEPHTVALLALAFPLLKRRLSPPVPQASRLHSQL